MAEALGAAVGAPHPQRATTDGNTVRSREWCHAPLSPHDKAPTKAENGPDLDEK